MISRCNANLDTMPLSFPPPSRAADLFWPVADWQVSVDDLKKADLRSDDDDDTITLMLRRPRIQRTAAITAEGRSPKRPHTNHSGALVG